MTVITGAIASGGGSPRLTRGSRVPDNPDVSVVILVVDDTALVRRCLDSIAATTTVACELIVVANGTGTSDTGTSELAKLAERDDIVLLRFSVNLGFGLGCNAGARVARGKYLMFLNDDTTVEAGWLEALVDTASTVPDVGAVGSRILFPDGRLQEAGAILWRNGKSQLVGYGLDADTNEYLSARDVDYCSGCSLLVTRAAWDSVGGFDDGYFPAYYDDSDLCMALRGAGYRVCYDPRSRVVHELSASSWATQWRRFIGPRNRERFVAKWHDELASHEEQPDADDETAIEAAVQRATNVRPTASPSTAEATQPVPMTEAEYAELELTAARRHIRIRDEFIEQLIERNSELRAQADKLQRVGNFARRLPGGEKLLSVASRRLLGS